MKANSETKKDFDIDTIDKEIYKPDKVDIPDRLIDFDNEDQMLTPNERLAKMKKKEEVRKMLSKQRFAVKQSVEHLFSNHFLRFSMQEINEHDLYDSDPYTQRRIEKVFDKKQRNEKLFVKSYFLFSGFEFTISNCRRSKRKKSSSCRLVYRNRIKKRNFSR